MDSGLKRIEVNGASIEVRAETLADLLIELDYGDRLVATAINQDFVRKTARAETVLKPMDRIEIVAPMQGG